MRIITDSAADMTQQELHCKDVKCVPMQVMFGEETFTAGQDLTDEQLWSRLLAGQIGKTSQPSPAAFLEAFEKIKAAGEEAVCICVSSALSGTLQSAKLALSMLEYDETEQEWSKHNTTPFATVGCHEVAIEPDGLNEQHIGVLNAWGDAILRGGKLVADGREGINGLTLSNAMHLSAFLGREIELPFDEKLYKEELMKRVAVSRRKTSGKTVFADTSNTYGGNK